MKVRLRHILSVVIVLLVAVAGQASHIIGGDLSYLCLGFDPVTNTNRYRVTMKIYRNCNRFSMDTFSDPAPISIYRGNAEPYDSVANLQVRLQTPIVPIPPDVSNPCLTLPPDICVQEGTYVFEIDLPVIDENYVITYQRCCRNATITNIFTPDRIGATYVIELTPEAQQVCNNSPIFNEFPPIVICANEPLFFDHSATDAEGDQLVYGFCSPLKGGGIAGAFAPGDPESCRGFRPDPSCAPPYEEVDFIIPAYTPLVPMGGSPIINIDPVTGLISGIPDVQGQFVVGICVQEFRNGQLLSVTRRDFQFNVADCEPLVQARIDADEIIGPQHFLIRTCGETDIGLINLSQQFSNIDTFAWIFDIEGQEIRLDDWNPLLSLPDTGRYDGFLFLNPGSNCGDTARITIQVYPEIAANFSYDFDTCVAGPVSFTDESVSQAGPIIDWFWAFGLDGNSEEQNPEYLFDSPGAQTVRLTVEDENGCRATRLDAIEWVPAPALIVVEPTTFLGCAPQEITFNNLSNPIDETYTILWDLGDGTTSSDISPSHVYEEGVYSISVEITSPIGCFVEESWEDWIRVRPNPTADFVFTPEELSNFDPTAFFTDQSIDAVAWNWDFGGVGNSILQNPTFTFPDTGRYEIMLTATHEEGCQDTITKIIDVQPLITYFVPNAFTPNSDDLNDGFRGGGFFDGIRNFEMRIWNRWGEMVFQTDQPSNSWNGRKNNNGDLAPKGVYVYTITFIGPRGQSRQLKGFVTLIK
ncbi:MAG: PKD domain-containing protein [Bacteroidota bacterium]